MERGLAFAFAPRGAEWPGWGRELHRTEPVYRDSIAKSSEEIRGRLGWSLEAELFRPAGEYRLHRAEELVEPALVAHQIALCGLLDHYGIRPQAVVAVGTGELAGAWAAGCVTAEAALRLACAVSELLRCGFARGRVAGVHAPAGALEGLLSGFPSVRVAADVGGAVVLAGASADVMAVIKRLVAAGVYCFLLPTRSLLHTDRLDEGKREFLAALAEPRLESSPARLPFYAASTGGRVPERAPGADHWWGIVRNPARCAAALRSALDDGFSAYVEIGHHPALSNVIEAVARASGRPVRTSCATRKDAPARSALWALFESLTSSRRDR